jgi:N,N'-diacetyllegionaminate synthase
MGFMKPESRPMVIAEIGANHGGDMSLAKEMIRVAAECGADVVKFQSWQSKNLAPDDPNYDRHRKAELSDENHYELIDACKTHGVQFLTTCFDIHRVDFLASLGLKAIKVASPDLASSNLIRVLRDRFEYLIISTGMSRDTEVMATAEILRDTPFAFLHCVSVYPTPAHMVRLRRMEWLRQFTPDVGFSDHTMGSHAAAAAMSLGASIIEKHFTIDRSLPGKDQAVSATPDELRDICSFARELPSLLGRSNDVDILPEEVDNRTRYVGKWGNNR